MQCATGVDRQRQLRVDAGVGGADGSQVKDHLWRCLGNGSPHRSRDAHVKGQPVDLDGQRRNTLGRFIRCNTRIDPRPSSHHSPNQMLAKKAGSSSDEDAFSYWFKNSRYHSSVSRNPSSSVYRGTQPNMPRALLLSKYWA